MHRCKVVGNVFGTSRCNMYKSDEWPSYFLICEYNVGRKVTDHEKFRNYLFKFKSTMNYLAKSIYRYPFMKKMTMAFSAKKKTKNVGQNSTQPNAAANL